uniref:ADAM_spacer1 domain-containing protein n=1 Tax=Steinernema glaseri TaxID=37863 RepID=A0A1I7Z2F4_9BILA
MAAAPTERTSPRDSTTRDAAASTRSSVGCGCEYAQFGCCPDGKSSAKGVGFYGCPESCAQSQFGCCPDGKTAARGSNKEGCPCQYTRYGCCPDGETTALGPKSEGCDDCRYAKYGCCPDGETKSLGPDYAGCPSTTVAPFMVGGTVSPQKILACGLPQDQGTVCHPGYKLVWFYDTAEGRCSQFWYGGCEGNENRFATKEQCETICVDPPEQGRCYLQKVEGPQRCNQLSPRYWYDYTTGQCAAFWWRGCLGNANNFVSWEECNTVCAGVGPPEQETPAPALLQPQHALPVQIPTEAPYVPEQPVPQQYPEPAQESHPDQARILAEHEAESHPDQARILAEHEAVRAEEQRRREEHFRREQERREHEARLQRPQTPAAPVVSADEQLCRLTVDAGNCGNFSEAYYFDFFSGRCHRFVFSGCGGNQNRFRSPQECEARCGRFRAGKPQEQRVRPRDRPGPRSQSREVCNQRVDVGRCDGHFTSYYYEVASGTCETFQYTGCGGNQNRFPSKEQCEALCLRAAAQPRIGEGAQSREVCNQRVDVGRCDGHFTSYYYEVASGTCETFQYTGCGGNQNRFPSKEQCEALCLRAAAQPRIGEGVAPAVHQEAPKTSAVCDEAKDTGPCSNFATKWFFNNNDGTCNRFHYGGCEGTGNRFDSEQECKATCGDHIDTCVLPKVKGPCGGKNKRFFFNKDSQQCEEFVYSGCLGNSNNFDSQEECEKRCPTASSE